MRNFTKVKKYKDWYDMFVKYNGIYTSESLAKLTIVDEIESQRDLMEMTVGGYLKRNQRKYIRCGFKIYSRLYPTSY